MSSLILLCGLTCVAGCVTEGRSTQAQGPVCPWPEANPPTEMVSLMDDLQVFQKLVGLPADTLSRLDKAPFKHQGGPYASQGFVYRAQGIGILRESWRIMAIDRVMRNEGYVWCLLRPPVLVDGEAPVRLAEVPVSELEQVAERMGR